MFCDKLLLIASPRDSTGTTIDTSTGTTIDTNTSRGVPTSSTGSHIEGGYKHEIFRLQVADLYTVSYTQLGEVYRIMCYCAH